MLNQLHIRPVWSQHRTNGGQTPKGGPNPIRTKYYDSVFESTNERLQWAFRTPYIYICIPGERRMDEELQWNCISSREVSTFSTCLNGPKNHWEESGWQGVEVASHHHLLELVIINRNWWARAHNLEIMNDFVPTWMNNNDKLWLSLCS